MKKILVLIMILFCTGCTNNSPNIDDKPSIDIPSVLPENEDDLSEESNEEYYKLLLSYIYIDVITLDYVTLPNSINNIDIIWTYDNKYITSLKGDNTTFKVIANIGKYNKEFEVIFTNGLVSSIVQQDLNFYYMFVTNSNKLGSYMNPNKIVIHNTANTALARNEVLYLNSITNTSSTSFHFAVDDTSIYQAIPLNIYAHHAGNLEVNKESIGIEIARSTSTDNAIKDKAINNAQKLIRLLQMKYNISDLMTHKDVTGKHCPHDILDRYMIDVFYKELEDSYIIY